MSSLDKREIWLIRHGETTANSAGLFSGWGDVPLTERGREQARALRPKLKEIYFDSVWSSDLRRAIDTARLAYGEPMQDRRLRELNFGELEQTLWLDLDEVLRDSLMAFQGFRAPGGESTEELEKRVRDFIADLAPGRHLLVCHGGTARVLLRDLGCDRFLQNGEISTLEL